VVGEKRITKTSHFNPFLIATHTHPHTLITADVYWSGNDTKPQLQATRIVRSWTPISTASVSLGGQKRYHPVPSATPSGMQKTALMGCL